jgi:hypothetical protein
MGDGRAHARPEKRGSQDSTKPFPAESGIGRPQWAMCLTEMVFMPCVLILNFARAVPMNHDCAAAIL